jgi:tape measure domain-containing protein
VAGTLGTLAVAITGSLSGLEKAFSDIESKADAFGRKMEAAGKTVSNVGRGITSVGNTMTKYITAPVVGVTAAVGGMVAAFGWGRLKAIDAAKAQLEGLGYAVEDVERISKHVSAAVQGTIMTMAEGTSVAAGALAAGVKEGAELEKYIKLVGSAAVGANRPISDMAQIFNRVQGGGRLMTRELNMIEQGMPGFAMAMSKHLGVSLEEFRKMVTGGKVSSREFLTVMEDFAGGMADAYAGTWEGMVANTKANIGIIGESLLSGVFEQSKESIAEFLDLLRSDKVREWAKETGAKIAETFGKIIEKVKSLIEWWGGLSDGTKKAIATIAGILVAAGPVLIVVGKLTTAVGGIMQAFKFLGPAVSSAGAAISALTGPVGWIIAGVAALVAAIILLWRHSEEFRDGVKEIWETIKATVGPIIEMLKENIGKMMEAMGPSLEILKNAFMDLLPILKFVGAVLGGIVAIGFSIVIGVINGLIKVIAPLIQAFGGLIAFVTNVVNAIVALFKGDFAGAFGYLIKAGQGLVDFVGGMVNAVWGFISGLVTGIVNFFKNLYNALVGHSIIPDLVNGIISWLKKLPGKALEFARSFVSNMTNTIKALPGRALQWGADIISSLWTGMRNIFGSLSAWFSNNVVGLLNKLNPFTRHSPSLVDQVWAGAKEIEKAYRSIELPELAAMSLQLTPAVAGLGAMGAIQQYDVGSREVKHSGTITIKGVNDQGQLVGVVDAVIERLIAEVRA